MIKRGNNCKGIWEIFEILHKDEELGILSPNEAQLLRDEVLTAALTNNSWLNVVVDAAHYLLAAYDFRWPDLYIKIIHHMLENCRHQDSIRWHLCLAPKFLPSTEIFGAIFSSFILDPSPPMRSTLMALYISSAEKNIYDYIIPVLFAAGRSKSARFWRKTLLAFGDFPKSNRSRPFLHFLDQYYPSISLTHEERVVAQVTDLFIDNPPSHSNNHHRSSKGQYSDSIVAKWFASSWISIDFAINLARRLGLRAMGPRSLQSLALREPGAKRLALRLARIEKLGITVSSKNYCKALASFAKHEQDSLLADFLTCDIHPDEFEDAEMRQILMAASVRNRDWRRQRLLQGIEWAIESEPSSSRLNALLQRELATYQLGRAKQVLDRMEALKVNISRQSASQFLMAAFRGIGKHSAKRRNRSSKSHTRSQSLLNEAIEIVRRIALHNMAIPLRYWKLLVCNLGRSGRLDELQQLSEEIVQLYAPGSGGLVPICHEDLPRSLPPARTATNLACNSSRPLVYETFAKKDLSQKVDSSSCSTLCNFNSRTAEGSRQGWDQAPQDIMTRDSPYLMAVKNSLQDMKPHTEACDDGDCLMLCIPADLSLSHRQHPVQQIFDVTFQRSIVRWAFNQKLHLPPSRPSLEGLRESGNAVCDITRGVQLLARLRDLGVPVDLQLLRTVVLSKIALGQVPGRKRHRSRDRHEVSSEHLKILFDEAWGSEILPDTLEMRRQIDKQKPKLWSRYSRLFGQSFDEPQKPSHEDILSDKILF
ncbi:hypothetical protein E4U43_007533 [Claviceps pusilla]|uniref:Pentatricopeptide repeat domain-containing protein n=1 Tax=Claviceps pusilla TaxID=123648 RepID=A0A9P7T2M7_9HYPO|nr:hypothetical protein E4U43_007533 [Claviceps pusilla]